MLVLGILMIAALFEDNASTELSLNIAGFLLMIIIPFFCAPLKGNR